MKKIYYCFTLCLFLIPNLAQAAADKSYIYDYDGNVVLVRRGVGITLRVDTVLENNDILKTDVDGKMDITMNQLAAARFYGSAECVLDNIQSGSTHLELNDGQGLFNLKASPSGGSFVVETKNIIATATLIAQFWCKTEGDGNNVKTVFVVKKGQIQVTVKASGSTINVLEGQALNISSDNFISAPRNATEAESKTVRNINAIIIDSDKT